MDVIEELKFLGKFTKKCFLGGGGGGSGWMVNEEMKFLVKIQNKIGGGGRVGGGQGGCDRRIEVFGKNH